MNEMSSKKPRVVFEQYVIPHYRVPFFTELSKKVDLIVVATKDKRVDGLNNVQGNLPFKTAYLEQKRESGLFHPDIFKVIERHKADVLISFGSSLELMLNNRDAIKRIKELKLKIMGMGCDGYMVKHFRTHLIYSLLNPLSFRSTIKSLIARSRTDFFLPHASYNARYLHLSRFVPKNKMRVVGNAIDTSVLTREYKRLTSRGNNKIPRKIVFTGRLVPSKRADMLIKAFYEVHKIYNDASLDIIGEGSELERLQKLTRDLDLSNSVKFVGAIYDDIKMAEHIYRASLFVMPSLGGLGFNTAMAVGLPIIYTDADGTEKDLIVDGKNGWYFNGTKKDLVKKIKFALFDQEKLEKMGLISLEIVTNIFNLENMVKAYVESIELVMKNK